jgi:phenylacetate-CoA ligase
MVYSSYHLNGGDLRIIYDHLLKFNPRFIQAYPSAANLLATYIEESGKPPPSNLKALLLGSENLPLWQRQRIEKAFDATVYSWYGHAEKAVLAAENPGRTELHVLPTYGYVYLRSEDGRIIEEPGIPGEIIATGFTNQATQFINYRTGDIGVWADSNDLSSRVLERVEGRAQELAITATGRKISMAAINMHTDIFDHVKQFRFVQDRKGAIKMEIVRKRGYSPGDERTIRDGVSRKLGADMELDISYVDSIPRASSGKARFMVQKLHTNDQ